MEGESHGILLFPLYFLLHFDLTLLLQISLIIFIAQRAVDELFGSERQVSYVIHNFAVGLLAGVPHTHLFGVNFPFFLFPVDGLPLFLHFVSFSLYPCESFGQFRISYNPPDCSFIE